MFEEENPLIEEQHCGCKKKHEEHHCGCKKKHEKHEMFENNEPDLKLARAYVPFQHASELYPPETSLIRGTVFPELDIPYKPKSHCKCKLSINF